MHCLIFDLRKEVLRKTAKQGFMLLPYPKLKEKHK
jgi:hypothetical protein